MSRRLTRQITGRHKNINRFRSGHYFCRGGEESRGKIEGFVHQQCVHPTRISSGRMLTRQSCRAVKTTSSVMIKSGFAGSIKSRRHFTHQKQRGPHVVSPEYACTSSLPLGSDLSPLRAPSGRDVSLPPRRFLQSPETLWEIFVVPEYFRWSLSLRKEDCSHGCDLFECVFFSLLRETFFAELDNTVNLT